MITTLDLFMSALAGFGIGVGIMIHLRDLERDALENAKLSEMRKITNEVEQWADAIKERS